VKKKRKCSSGFQNMRNSELPVSSSEQESNNGLAENFEAFIHFRFRFREATGGKKLFKHRDRRDNTSVSPRASWASCDGLPGGLAELLASNRCVCVCVRGGESQGGRDRMDSRDCGSAAAFPQTGSPPPPPPPRRADESRNKRILFTFFFFKDAHARLGERRCEVDSARKCGVVLEVVGRERKRFSFFTFLCTSRQMSFILS